LVIVVLLPLTNVVCDFSDLVIAFSDLVLAFSDLVLAFLDILLASLVPVPLLLAASIVDVPRVLVACVFIWFMTRKEACNGIESLIVSDLAASIPNQALILPNLYAGLPAFFLPLAL
ncbi:hypothetical protein Tco_1481360, partial [Tanacetum coccineum]